MSNRVITISREFGSGGHLIGKRLAEKLQIPFYDKELLKDYSIVLPVVSTALGNSMIFCYRFDDNYSAGQKSVYKEGVTDTTTTENKQKTGYFGDYVPYCDYYGRYYYMDLRLLMGYNQGKMH